MKVASLGGKSNESVQKATGKSWEEWIDILDTAGLKDTPHKDIVQWLWDHDYAGNEAQPLSGWWAQSIVVGYEYHHGLRTKGKTKDRGFEVGVQRTFPLSRQDLWELITSDAGLAIWIGGSLDEISLEPGASFTSSDGTRGEIRSFKAGERIRLRYQPAERAEPTTLQLYVAEKGPDKASLLFHQEQLQDEDDREAMKAHWQTVLKKLVEAA